MRASHGDPERTKMETNFDFNGVLGEFLVGRIPERADLFRYFTNEVQQRMLARKFVAEVIYCQGTENRD